MDFDEVLGVLLSSYRSANHGSPSPIFISWTLKRLSDGNTKQPKSRLLLLMQIFVAFQAAVIILFASLGQEIRLLRHHLFFVKDKTLHN